MQKYEAAISFWFFFFVGKAKRTIVHREFIDK